MIIKQLVSWIRSANHIRLKIGPYDTVIAGNESITTIILTQVNYRLCVIH